MPTQLINVVIEIRNINNTYTKMRIQAQAQKLNINPIQVRDTKKEKIPIIPDIIDIHQIILNIIFQAVFIFPFMSFTNLDPKTALIRL